MCGIVGYIGGRSAAEILLEGLGRLEYRGYDSAGIAVVGQDGQIAVRKCVGKLANLVECLRDDMPAGTVGIGHTRWATHGKPSDINAHPHSDCSDDVVVIHNGIVENYLHLRQQLIEEGHQFRSETDTEVIPHLIERQIKAGRSLEDAVRAVVGEIKGAQAILVVSRCDPTKIVAVRIGNAGGIVVGCGEGEMYVASDMPAILPHTRSMVFLDNREVAVLTQDGARYYSAVGERIEKEICTVPYDAFVAAKGGYRHFMLKEIMEQPEAIMDTFRGRVDLSRSEVYLDGIPFSADQWRGLKKLAIVACGTSYYAGLVGKFMLEELARIPVEVDYASEFRYRHPVIDEETLLIPVSQSGETVDTLAAMEEARARGTKQIAICNVVGSQATRVADAVIYTQAGPEFGVAASKTFTTQMVAFYLLALYLGQVRGTLERGRVAALLEHLSLLPNLMGQVLDDHGRIERIAHAYHRAFNFLFLGRGISYPIALEGALKLKEISYIHAEGYPGGEMKHGPIALIDENLPVVAIALQDGVYDKILNNIEEVKARDGIVIAVANEGDRTIATKADEVIYIPRTDPLLSPLLSILPLQLLAYHIAVRRGCDVDQPRNLAKSVTVE